MLDAEIVKQVAERLHSLSQEEFNTECMRMYKQKHWQTLSMEEVREFR